MLVVSQQPYFITKVLTDGMGREFKVTFLVRIINGELKGRIISAEPVQSSLKLSGSCSANTFYLPSACAEEKSLYSSYCFHTSVISPYNELLFFSSQPTRAPARV